MPLLPELKMATTPASQPASPRASEAARDARAARLSAPRPETICSPGARGGASALPPAAANQGAGPARLGPPARGVCEDALAVAECLSRGAVAVVPAAAAAAPADAEHRTLARWRGGRKVKP